ncbi:MAG TPA: LPXTG cell wall anchor domain-containing protein [Candidatus Mediterraneibacter merdipullorum]|nr:LPXTG cell wall anchor domain-containing protein [Candidatus Mediterraneibacter merdipullorum]
MQQFVNVGSVTRPASAFEDFSDVKGIRIFIGKKMMDGIRKSKNVRKLEINEKDVSIFGDTVYRKGLDKNDGSCDNVSKQAGNTVSPQTGDDSNIALWIAVMLAAGTALTGTVFYSRRRKCSR